MSRFYVAHPNIFPFLSVLEEVQLNTGMIMNAAKRRIKKATKFIEQMSEHHDNMIKSSEKKELMHAHSYRRYSIVICWQAYRLKGGGCNAVRLLVVHPG